MLWGIMNLQPFNDAPRFFCRIAFVQRSRFMCIEVIITGMIFSASGYMTSDRYLISSAQSTAVRCSRTLTWCVPPSGSTKANMLTVPLRTYSESVFRSLPGIIGSGSQEAGMAFHPCRQPGALRHKVVHRHQEHPPYMLWIRDLLLLGYTSSRFCEVEVCFF